MKIVGRFFFFSIFILIRKILAVRENAEGTIGDVAKEKLMVIVSH